PAAPTAPADLVLLGGKIWTVDGKHPEVRALAARDGRIIAVGSDADIKPLVGPATHVIDLDGKRVLPGFHDSHVHFLSSGQRLSQVALKDAKDEKEWGRRLKEFDARLGPGRWMLGGDWDHDRAFVGKLPTAAHLD